MQNATAPVQVVEVNASDKAALAEFVTLERSLLSRYPRYYPGELDPDVTNKLAGKSPFFDETKYALFTVPGASPVARCVAFVNKRYQAHSPSKANTGSIGYFAAAPDSADAVKAMLGYAEEWLKKRGVKKVVSPFSGAAMVGMMALTDGYDEEPMFPFPWNPPYYRDYFEQSGYAPTYPLWQYWVDFSTTQYRAAARKSAESFRARVRHIEKRRWNEDLEIYRSLFNECFADEWEMQEVTSAEWKAFFDPMKPLLDTRQHLLAEVDGEPAGFCMGMPDYTPHFRAFNGKMGPLQILRFMFTSRKYRRAGLLGIGVRKKFRGLGIAAALATTLYRHYESKGLRGAFYYVVNDSNAPSRRFATSLGGQGKIQYHCFEKQL